jgi:hypothetical protein
MVAPLDLGDNAAFYALILLYLSYRMRIANKFNPENGQFQKSDNFLCNLKITSPGTY